MPNRTQDTFPRIIERILQAHPNLTANGFDDLGESKKTLNTVEKEKSFLNLRELLLGSEQEFWMCVRYLENYPSKKAQSYGSYSLKHNIERTFNSYISNGTLISAAAYLSLRVRPIKNTPNALIQIGGFR